ncbi:MAG: hypothetical protein H0W62_00235 [Chitinophagales bacterium]|nr:hypothetical protein [Chitinophagales bacterium]
MKAYTIFILVSGLVLVITGIVTFYGKNKVNDKHFRFMGIKADRIAFALGLFLSGMVFILIFLIEVMGPHFIEEGL